MTERQDATRVNGSSGRRMSKPWRDPSSDPPRDNVRVEILLKKNGDTVSAWWDVKMGAWHATIFGKLSILSCTEVAGWRERSTERPWRDPVTDPPPRVGIVEIVCRGSDVPVAAL